MKSIFAAGTLLLAAAAMPFAAVAQETTTAQSIFVAEKYQKDWTKGSVLEAQGLKELEAAKKDLVEYSADVVDAQNKRESSQARAENASAEFRALTSNMPEFSDAGEAERWAGKVKKAASSWAKHDDRKGDVGSDLKKYTKKQRKAQAAVDKAQAKVDRGRSMKTKAERLSMSPRR